jgi:hypothetical protein
MVCCHNGICFNCGLEKLRNKKKKYRWNEWTKIIRTETRRHNDGVRHCLKVRLWIWELWRKKTSQCIWSGWTILKSWVSISFLHNGLEQN